MVASAVSETRSLPALDMPLRRRFGFGVESQPRLAAFAPADVGVDRASAEHRDLERFATGELGQQPDEADTPRLPRERRGSKLRKLPPNSGTPNNA